MTKKQKLAVVCGGSGSSKFVVPLKEHLPSKFQPYFIANVADNFWHYGVYICPDVDILLYSLAGMLDTSKGWGIKDDTSTFFKAYSKLNPQDAWFRLGDADLAVCLRRTELLRKGWSLSRITEFLKRAFGVNEELIPASDDKLQTFIETRGRKRMHLQDFWVKRSGIDAVKRVSFVGSRTAKPNPKLLNALTQTVLILPANPISSILPTLALDGVRRGLQRARRIVALSPFSGNKPFSGPASEFMTAMGYEQNSFGVAKLYSDFLDLLIVDKREEADMIRKIRDIGVDCEKGEIHVNPHNRKSIVDGIVQAL